MLVRMRLVMAIVFSALCGVSAAMASDIAKTDVSASSEAIEVTADQSLEWYQEQHLYVARGKAKAVRGGMTVEADILSAHERDKADNKPKPTVTQGAAAKSLGGGDIDRLTADGNVHIYDQRQQVFGDKAVYDADRRVAQVTGDNLKYMTDKDVVTARDMLEYYQDRNLAVARGKAVAVHEGRHVEGDVLTASFVESKDGQMDLSKMTAEGHVVVLTANDVARGDRAVYDVHGNVAVLTGHVRVTRADGTQLTGDVATVDFAKGESRMLNQGGGRVRALLGPKPDKAGATSR